VNQLSKNELIEKLQSIRCLILDIDGVMTNGKIFWLEEFGWTRFFDIKDGYGLKLLMKSGFPVGVISSGDSKDVRTRCKFLKIENAFFGDEDKLTSLEKMEAATGVARNEMAFIGDELFDLPVLEAVGFPISVPNAVKTVQKRACWVTKNSGGDGAVREVVDSIRKAQNIGPFSEDLDWPF